MARVKCPDCGGQVSDQALGCPCCGAPGPGAGQIARAPDSAARASRQVPPKRRGRAWPWIVGAIVLGAALTGYNVASGPSGQAWRLIGSQGTTQFVLVDKAREADEAAYRDAIDGVCVSAQPCFIRFWSDPEAVASSLPMTSAQSAALTAAYNRNPHTGLDKLLWSCRIVSDPSRCLASTAHSQSK